MGLCGPFGAKSALKASDVCRYASVQLRTVEFALQPEHYGRLANSDRFGYLSLRNSVAS